MKKCNNTKTKRMNVNKRRSSANGSNTSTVGAVTSLILMSAFMAALALPGNAFADAPSLTISVDNGAGGTDLDLTMMPDFADGTFKQSNNLNISVSTTNIIGYTLGIAADSSISGNSDGGNVPLINTSDSSIKIPSITSSVSATDFQAAGSTGAAYNNKWGYKPSKYNSTSNTTNYYPAPSTVGDVLDVTTVSSGMPNNYTISFGTRIDSNTKPGAYNNTFVITAVANFAQYSINYYAGSGSSDVSLAHMPTNETGFITDSTLPMSSHIPTRNSFGFLGWCAGTANSSNITTNNGVDTCSSTVYLAGKGINVAQYSDTTLYLYAMWSNGLYDKVASLVKRDNGIPRTQSLADMQAVITEPTSSEPLYDKSNSGVYAYDAATYGTASDANNNYPIYYYRGWLDRTFASTDDYGGVPSTGDSGYYPNYVRLSDTTGGKTSTCWRIVRTTGSGGIKMIYNGTWTGSTCANDGSNATAGGAYFNRGVGYENTSDLDCNTANNDYCDTFGRSTLEGYNYNSVYANDKSATAAISNSILFNNESPSNIRIKIESWYANVSNLVNYAASNKLEASAGWCDDRTTADSPLATDTFPPYYPNWFAFGPYRRNVSVNGKLTLTCYNVTNNDILTTSNGLGAPLAPLTEDEAALVGNGYYSNYVDPDDGPNTESQLSSNYSFRSYIRSGASFWLLSPRDLGSDSLGLFGVSLSGNSYYPRVFVSIKLRPAISLAHASRIASGSGTSTDPWVITAAADTDYSVTMQNATLADCGKTMVDTRDGNSYSTAILKDGKCWMTKNLDLAGGTALSAADTDVSADYINNFTTSNNLAKSGNTIVLPASSTSGFDTVNYSYVANSGSTVCGDNSPCYSYYSWDAATLGSGRSISTDNTDTLYSICPRGWRLPRIRSVSASNWQTENDFYVMAHKYGLDSTISTDESDADFYNNAGPSTVPNFLLAGYYGNGSFYNGGSNGRYWSSTPLGNSADTFSLYFDSGRAFSANHNFRYYGFGIRCILNN